VLDDDMGSRVEIGSTVLGKFCGSDHCRGDRIIVSHVFSFCYLAVIVVVLLLKKFEQ
jgi:hypothetical protein